MSKAERTEEHMKIVRDLFDKYGEGGGALGYINLCYGLGQAIADAERRGFVQGVKQAVGVAYYDSHASILALLPPDEVA